MTRERSIYEQYAFPHSFMEWGKAVEILHEGLITTYPADSFETALRIEIFKEKKKQQHQGRANVTFDHHDFLDDDAYHNVFLNCDTDLWEMVKDICGKVAQTYGYQITKVTKSWKKTTNVFFEPLYPQKFSIKDIPTDWTVYHITAKKNIDKIQKIGLHPKRSQTMFNHPGNRVYFIVTNDFNEVEDLRKSLSDAKEEADMSVFVVDKDKLPSVGLFYDPALGGGANATYRGFFSLLPVNKEALTLLDI